MKTSEIRIGSFYAVTVGSGRDKTLDSNIRRFFVSILFTHPALPRRSYYDGEIVGRLDSNL